MNTKTQESINQIAIGIMGFAALLLIAYSGFQFGVWLK